MIPFALPEILEDRISLDCREIFTNNIFLPIEKAKEAKVLEKYALQQLILHHAGIDLFPV